MIHFWIIVILLNSYAIRSHTMGNQITGSGSGSAGNAGALPISIKLDPKPQENLHTSGSLISPPGGLAIRAMATQTSEQKIKTEHVNKQLQSLSGDHNWKQRREIVTKAVQEDIHPDLLKNNGETPLGDVADKTTQADVDFARFLLKHSANPNQRSERHPHHLAFGRVKNPTMAQLFYDHGGAQTVKDNAPELLSHTVDLCEANVQMMEWYTARGADANEFYDGQTLLHRVALFLCSSSHLEAVQFLAQEGALLHPIITKSRHFRNGCNVPQLIKLSLDEEQEVLRTPQPQMANFIDAVLLHAPLEYRHNPALLYGASNERIALLASARNCLAAASYYRCAGLQEHILAATTLIPEIAKLIVLYYTKEEPSYEVLETEPLPHSDSLRDTAAV